MKYTVNFKAPETDSWKDFQEHLTIMKKCYPEFKPFSVEADNIKEAREKVYEILGKSLSYELRGELYIHNTKTTKSYNY